MQRIFRTRYLILVLIMLVCFTPRSHAQKSKGKKTPQPQAKPAEEPKKDKGPFKPYSEVITKKAVSDPGVFTVHKVESKHYFEIPDSLLSKREFLLSSKTSGFVENLDFGGAGMAPKSEQVVRWDKVDNKILLRVVSYNNIASEELPIYKSVKYNNFEPVLYSFDIQAIGKDSLSYVISVDELFTTDVDFLGPLSNEQRKDFQIRNLDRNRSLITSVKSFPQNVEVRHILTYAGTQIPSNKETSSLSVEMNQSFVLLPEKPMMPRLYDPRVGFFSVQVNDYGSPEHKTVKKQFITRWRLEPKDWDAYNRGELVEPVKPIVYYIDPATPVQWRKYLKQGVEDWQQAFEKIGFKNAIVAKDAPTPEEDPDWSPEDIRYSVIRYIATTIINAQGPHTHDPRSGEIIESDILWYHNVTKWLRALTLTQTGVVNPNARKPKLSDEDMGLMIRYVCAHEVGHTLGFPHNMGASYAYPVDSLRSATFTKKWGITPSIMDYARANYVAQPGDEGVHLFNNKIGPYDDYAIMWGYKPIPGATTPEEETKTLNQWITERAGNPVYKFGRQTFLRHVDPRSQTEDLGNDAVKAGTYGIENLKRIVPQLMSWTSEPGKNYETLQESYSDAVNQWSRYIGHVVHNIGGVYETYKTSDQNGPVYEYVPKKKQQEAMKFLNQQAFQKPAYLVDENILRRLEHAGNVERIRQIQVNNLNLLLDPSRFAVLLDAESLQGQQVYTVNDMLTDLRNGLWAELKTGKEIDIYRRNLQRALIDKYGQLMKNDQVNVVPAARSALGFTPVNVNHSDIRPFIRGELKIIRNSLKQALALTKDTATRYHIEESIVRIDQILDPK
ncbi:MAG: zinc-dependent metalloprotease [Cyclobacteriaceae bacterium]|nr:zinc-dependent metalloprotease [Cyclobacteriaceae bacterium]